MRYNCKPPCEPQEEKTLEEFPARERARKIAVTAYKRQMEECEDGGKKRSVCTMCGERIRAFEHASAQFAHSFQIMI